MVSGDSSAIAGRSNRARPLGVGADIHCCDGTIGGRAISGSVVVAQRTLGAQQIRGLPIMTDTESTPQGPDAADLPGVVDQFAQHLIANNVAALMPMFTPQGLMQAMALQSQPDSAQGSTSYVVEPQGGDRYEILFRGDDGEGGITTAWVAEGGFWKVSEIARLSEE